MNTFSKVLSMFLVVVMCFGLFATSAYATEFDFGQGSNPAGQAGFGFGNDAAASDGFTLNEPETRTVITSP